MIGVNTPTSCGRTRRRGRATTVGNGTVFWAKLSTWRSPPPLYRIKIIHSSVRSLTLYRKVLKMSCPVSFRQQLARTPKCPAKHLTRSVGRTTTSTTINHSLGAPSLTKSYDRRSRQAMAPTSACGACILACALALCLLAEANASGMHVPHPRRSQEEQGVRTFV